jgi:hypothetical protein
MRRMMVVCAAAALCPERCNSLVSESGYLFSSQESVQHTVRYTELAPNRFKDR